MHFQPDKVEDFLRIFRSSREKIRGFEGCLFLELLRDVSSTNIFFTHSQWLSEEYLEMYRHSSLFKETWSETKPLFAEPACAWTVTKAV